MALGVAASCVALEGGIGNGKNGAPCSNVATSDNWQQCATRLRAPESQRPFFSSAWRLELGSLPRGHAPAFACFFSSSSSTCTRDDCGIAGTHVQRCTCRYMGCRQVPGCARAFLFTLFFYQLSQHRLPPIQKSRHFDTYATIHTFTLQ
eukprot:scaffold6843_cov149-Isochrysis_galbana.AAC.7